MDRDFYKDYVLFAMFDEQYLGLKASKIYWVNHFLDNNMICPLTFQHFLEVLIAYKAIYDKIIHENYKTVEEDIELLVRLSGVQESEGFYSILCSLEK